MQKPVTDLAQDQVVTSQLTEKETLNQNSRNWQSGCGWAKKVNASFKVADNRCNKFMYHCVI